MTATLFNQQLGRLTDGDTLRMQRRLPGPIERVWSYLTDSDLRRQWLASGSMPLQAGGSFELVWRNDELSDSADERPDGFSAESRAVCEFIDVEAPKRMRYLWPGVGEVSFELESMGDEVLLTLTHRKLAGDRLILNVCAGWDSHLTVLIARMQGDKPPSLWSTWRRLRAAYEAQLCAS